MKKWLLIVLFFSSVSFASAHVKWFATEGDSVRPYALTDIPVLVGIGAVLLMVVLGVYLEKKINVPTLLNRLLERIAPNVLSIASVGFGAAFLIFSFFGFIFAPNLPAYANGDILLLIQTLAGLMILLGVYERLGGLLLLVLFGLAVGRFGLIEMLDTLEMVGFAFYAMVIGRPKWHIVEAKWFSHLAHRFHEYGVSILRIGTGLNLMILGFSEKILTPALTSNFLLQYNWNFMHRLGFEWFTDYWFAFAAGVGEFLFGLFFLLGLVTRLNTIALAVFLVSTLILLGPVELIGHLPHFSIACVLLVFGAGSRWCFKKKECVGPASTK